MIEVRKTHDIGLETNMRPLSLSNFAGAYFAFHYCVLPITNENGEVGGESDTEAKNQIPLEEDAAERPALKSGQDRLHVSRKAIAKFGTTHGCPGCDAIIRRGHIAGRLGYNHSNTCRQRIFNEMTRDPEYKSLVDKHGI